MKKNILFVLALIFLCSLMIVGCGSDKPAGQTDQETAKPEERRFLTIGGAGSGGRWYAEAGALSEVLSRHLEGYKINPTSIDGVGYGNIDAIQANHVDAGIAYADQAVEAFKGEGRYEGKPQNVRAWFLQNPLFYTVIAKKNIKSIEDLRGKILGTGTPGSGDMEQALVVLNAYGIEKGDVTWREVGRDEAKNALIDNQIDAIILAWSRNNMLNQGFVLQSNSDTHLLAMDKGVAEKVIKEKPWLAIDEIGDPDLGYTGLLRLAIPSYRLVSSELPEETVYKMTKALWDNIDEVYEMAPWYKEEGVTIENATKLAIPLHPGAAKYYEEVGIKIPDLAKPVD